GGVFIGGVQDGEHIVGANLAERLDGIAGNYGFGSDNFPRNNIHDHASHQAIGTDGSNGIGFNKSCRFFLNHHLDGDASLLDHFNLAYRAYVYTGVTHVVAYNQAVYVSKGTVELNVFAENMLSVADGIKRRNKNGGAHHYEKTDFYFLGS